MLQNCRFWNVDTLLLGQVLMAARFAQGLPRTQSVQLATRASTEGLSTPPLPTAERTRPGSPGSPGSKDAKDAVFVVLEVRYGNGAPQQARIVPCPWGNSFHQGWNTSGTAVHCFGPGYGGVIQRGQRRQDVRRYNPHIANDIFAYDMVGLQEFFFRGSQVVEDVMPPIFCRIGAIFRPDWLASRRDCEVEKRCRPLVEVDVWQNSSHKSSSAAIVYIGRHRQIQLIDIGQVDIR